MKKNLKNNKGITLVALIVTIVVLLILAGITIAAVLADGGIFKTAQNSQKVQDTAKLEEKVKLMLTDAQIENKVNNKTLNEYFTEKGLNPKQDATTGTISIITEEHKVTINEENLEIVKIEESLIIEPNTNWYENPGENGVYTISTAEELAGLASLVNDGTDTFNGKTIVLGNNIDLQNKDWTPIGNSTNKFQGDFDGQNHTISNLKVIQEGKGNIGLFGFTAAKNWNSYTPEIKNLTVHNAIVKGRVNVGAIAGTPYTTEYTNIALTGLVQVDGMAYVGGMFGKNVYEDLTDLTVNVQPGSYVNANSVENGIAYRTYAGGVIGFMGENYPEGDYAFAVTNVTSNINVIGTTIDVGGITGIAHYGNSFINCSSSGNVTITNALDEDDAAEIGGIAGVWHRGGDNVIFTNCSYTGTLTATLEDGSSFTDFYNNGLVGRHFSNSGTGRLIIDGVDVTPET